MKYINKQIASQTAFNMLKSIRDKIEAKENELSSFCEKLIFDTISKKELELILQLSDWIEYINYAYFSCSYQTTRSSIKLNNKCPKRIGNYSVKISDENYEKIISFQNEIKGMKLKSNSIHDQIVANLLKLRTAEKIKKEFPEAFKNLPKDSMQIADLIAIPVERILSDINKFPE